MGLLVQDLQVEKERVEKQLRTMRQERNALAATLRQHGFLGKHSISSAGAHAAQHIASPEQDTTQAVRHRQNEEMSQSHECWSGDRSCSNGSPASQRSTAMPAGELRHGQEDTHLEQIPAQVAEHSPTHSSHSAKGFVSGLKDITNTAASRRASPGVEAKFVTPNTAQRSWTSKEHVSSPKGIAAQQHAETVQAQLQRLEEMARMLLM